MITNNQLLEKKELLEKLIEEKFTDLNIFAKRVKVLELEIEVLQDEIDAINQELRQDSVK